MKVAHQAAQQAVVVNALQILPDMEAVVVVVEVASAQAAAVQVATVIINMH